jgi:hypothetical protein
MMPFALPGLFFTMKELTWLDGSAGYSVRPAFGALAGQLAAARVTLVRRGDFVACLALSLTEC